MDIKNSTILITGGTAGLGLEMAKQFTKIGATVIITGRKTEALNEAKKLYPGVHTFQSDVSEPKDIEQLFDTVTKQFPKLNLIINNAGMMRLIDLQDQTLDLENINREVCTNLSGTIQMTHRFLPHLLKQKAAGIVNVSSGIAFMSYSAAPIYSATKAAVRAYTQALRLQLEDTNVRVFEMIPPGVKTKLQDDWVKKPDERMMMNADDMVKVVVQGLQKDKKELQPFMIRIIKLAARIMPGVMLKFGHREFKAIKRLQNK